MKIPYIKIILLLSLFAIPARAMDNAHFFRTPFFFGEPRFSKRRLGSFDISIAYGSTTKARDACGKCVPLLDLYGNYNMQLLGSNIPDKDPSSPEDLALIMLERTVGQNGFSYFSYGGKFHAFEAMLGWTQNINHGIFVQLWLPVRRVELTKVCRVDCTPNACPCPALDDPNWQLFLTLYDQILARYGLRATNYTEHGMGDMSLLAGWSCSYEGRKAIDYIDFAARFGFLIPTSPHQSLSSAFSVPLGYNGHMGFPLAVECSLGAYDWLTFGAHAEALPFAAKKYTTRFQTDCRQRGMIKLAKGLATVNHGAIWELGAFVKADHVSKGMSLLVGYIHQQEQCSHLCPECNCQEVTANCDPMLHGWSMDTMNFMIDYDFSKENHLLGARIGAFYNLQIAGKRVFQTNMYGGLLGVDFSMSF